MPNAFQIPVYNPQGDAYLQSVNYEYGIRGAGARYRFWALWGGVFFKDSVAQQRTQRDGGQVEIDRGSFPLPGSPLQSMSGIYPLWADGAMTVIPKGVNEGRTRGDSFAAVNSKLITAYRYDNKCTPIPMRSGFDPTGLVRERIDNQQLNWAGYLPLKLGLCALVNGYIPTVNGNVTLLTYADKALFATDHPVNPTDKALKAAQYSNKITISEVNETTWATVRDKILQIVGWDGVTIVHDAMAVPTIYVATYEAALPWIRIVGGERAVNQYRLVPLVIGGVPVGISSVSLGTADIVVDPYLYQVADDKSAIVKRAFINPNSGYKEGLIFREEQVPQVYVSSPEGYQAFNNKVIEVVSDAEVGIGIGDPRGIIEVALP